jgi:peroxiredoxin
MSIAFCLLGSWIWGMTVKGKVQVKQETVSRKVGGFITGHGHVIASTAAAFTATTSTSSLPNLSN